MPVINILAFNGGMNNKEAPHLLPPGVAVKAVNIDPSSVVLKPMKGTNSSPPGGHYYFNNISSWISDANADSWQEYDRWLYWSRGYASASYKARRQKTAGSPKDMGVREPGHTGSGGTIKPAGGPTPANADYAGLTGNPCYIIRTETAGGNNLPDNDDTSLEGRVIVGKTSGSTAKLNHFKKDGSNWWIYLKECYGWSIVEGIDVYSADLSTVEYTMSISPGYEPYRNIIRVNSDTHSNSLVVAGNYIQAPGNSQRFKDTTFYKIKSKLSGGYGYSDFRGVELTTEHLGAGGDAAIQVGPYLFKPGVTTLSFRLKITAVDADDFESAPCESSDEIELEAASQSIYWSNLPQSSDASTYKHYRTGGISSVYKQNESKTDRSNYTDSTWEAQLGDEPPEDNYPPVDGIKYLTEVNGMFFGAKDYNVYASRPSYPNAWPIEGLVSFEYPPTAIGKLAGEAVVFTANQAYRVRGADPESLVKSKILGEQGVPAGNYKTVAVLGKYLMFLSNDGICYYDGSSITVLTSHLLSDYNAPTNPVAGVKDNIYYCLGSTGEGYIVNAQNGLKFYKTTQTATMLHYRPNNDDLWTEAGQLGEGGYLPVEYITGEFVGENPIHINERKVFSHLEMTYSVASAGADIDVQFLVDGASKTFANNSTVTTLGSTGGNKTKRFIYLKDAEIGYAAQLQFNTTGNIEIHSVKIHYEYLAAYVQKMEFVSCSVFFTGTITVSIDVDGTPVKTNVSLTSLGESVESLSLNTNGHVPHLYNTGTGTITAVFWHTKEI